jgi:hypothetical protein
LTFGHKFVILLSIMAIEFGDNQGLPPSEANLVSKKFAGFHIDKPLKLDKPFGKSGSIGVVPTSALASDFSHAAYRMGSEAVYFVKDPEVVKASWEQGFTDPRRHADGNFRYLVHALNDSGSDLVQKISALQQLKEGTAEELGEDIDLLHEPHRIAERPIISASVIDQHHRGTFDNSGLLLSTLVENVIDSHSGDAGTDFMNPSKVIASSQKLVPAVEDLLSQTQPSIYNEVRLVGTSEAGKVQVEGVWIKVDEHGEPLSRETTDILIRYALRERLPIVKIGPERADFSFSEPEVITVGVNDDWSDPDSPTRYVPTLISLNRDGKRYNIHIRDDRFEVLNEYLRSHRMTQEEFDFAMKVIKLELSQDEQVQHHDILNGLTDKYEEFVRNNPPEPKKETTATNKERTSEYRDIYFHPLKPKYPYLPDDNLPEIKLREDEK